MTPKAQAYSRKLTKLAFLTKPISPENDVAVGWSAILGNKGSAPRESESVSV